MKKIAIIGWGNQAKAWALNLRDSGVEVAIGLRASSPSKNEVSALKFDTFDLNAPQDFQYYVLLIPDESHEKCLENPCFKDNAHIFYAHGHSLLYSKVAEKFPNFQHILFAPKAIASELRLLFETKGALSAVFDTSFAKSISEEEVKLLAQKLGITNLVKGTIKEETNADLFSEQTILCTLLPFGAASAFQKLVEKGYQEDIAFLETWVEVRLIANTMIKMGPKKFFDMISPNALIGASKGKREIFNNNYFETLETLFNDIESGKFQNEIAQSDINQIRRDMNAFWDKHPLESAFQKFKDKAL